jgi:hypothetical protein
VRGAIAARRRVLVDDKRAPQPDAVALIAADRGADVLRVRRADSTARATMFAIKARSRTRRRSVLALDELTRGFQLREAPRSSSSLTGGGPRYSAP